MDERDYAEEEYNRTFVEKEGLEELHADFCEERGLIPSEHMHGFVHRNGELFVLECIDCHNEEECDDQECLWCVPA